MDDVKSYIELNKKLIQTMVIKSETTALLINEEIRLKHYQTYIDPYDLSTWKYYRNIAGLPHSLNSDIRVVSFDTQEIIPFNSITLTEHKETRLNYSVGTRNYYKLINKYPNDELLILGALYPVDIYDAIASDDLTILGYDKSLVEPQELSLIHDLQNYIYKYDTRWNVKAFISSDNLYPAAQYGIFILNLLQELISIRNRNCHTSEAHSFHIREYLTSHYGLDRFMDYMLLEQILYLYRNIRYLERNVGKVSNFKTLVKNIVETRRLIPLYEISTKEKHDLDGQMLPVIYGKKDNITELLSASDSDIYSMDELEEKIRPRAIDNDWYMDNYNHIPRHKLATTHKNSMGTKYLVSDMVDYTDMLPYTIHEALMKHWIGMSNSNMYNTYVRFDNPFDDTEYYLHVTETLLYFFYILRSYYKIEDNTIPTLLNSKRLKYNKPKLDDMLALVPIEKRSKRMISVAKDIRDRFVNIKYTINHYDFYELCNDIYDYATWQWYLVSNIHGVDDRAYVKAMCDYMWVDEHISIDTNFTTMSQFLTARGLPLYEDRALMGLELLKNLYLASTGYVVNGFNTLRYIQHMLTEALLILSSYTIDVIRIINDSEINLSNWAAIRIGNEKISGGSEVYISPYIDVIGLHTSIENFSTYELGDMEINSYLGSISMYSFFDMIRPDTNPKVTRSDSVHAIQLKFRDTQPWNRYLVGLTNDQIENIPTIN